MDGSRVDTLHRKLAALVILTVGLLVFLTMLVWDFIQTVFG